MPLPIVNRGGVRTVHVTVHDLCAGTETSQRFAFATEHTTVLDHSVVTGRDYRIEVAGVGVDAASEEYRDRCHSPRVVVASDGSITVESIPVM